MYFVLECLLLLLLFCFVFDVCVHFVSFFENQYRYCVEYFAKMICGMKVVLLALKRKTNVIFVPTNSFLYPACSLKQLLSHNNFLCNIPPRKYKTFYLEYMSSIPLFSCSTLAYPYIYYIFVRHSSCFDMCVEFLSNHHLVVCSVYK